MLRSIRNLYGCRVHAADGDLGAIHDFYFEGRAWTIQYLGLNTGKPSSCTLAFLPIDELGRSWVGEGVVSSLLTKSQVQQRQLTRRNPERAGAAHLVQSASPSTLSGVPDPIPAGPYQARPTSAGHDGEVEPPWSYFRLQGVRQMLGFNVLATDGLVGRVEDLVCDDEDWGIRSMVLTADGLASRPVVLIAPQWVEQVDWSHSQIRLYVSLDMVQKNFTAQADLAATCQLHVSIFLPTHRMAQDIQGDRFRLKTLIRCAERQLTESGMCTSSTRNLLEPAQRLLWNVPFWEHQGSGLALFLSRRFCHYSRLPYRVDELAVVSHRFHFKPLVPLLGGCGRYFVLWLGPKQAKLLRGTQYSLTEVSLGSESDQLVLASPDGAFARCLSSSGESAIPRPAGQQPPIVRGLGASCDDAEMCVLRSFCGIDGLVNKVLRDGHAPLVLAGDGHTISVYTQANTYPHLVDTSVPAVPGSLSAAQVHSRSWAIVQPLFQAERQAALAECIALLHAGSERASGTLRQIVRAAQNGQVKTLFVADGVQRWGFLDHQNDRIVIHPELAPGDEDLLDLAVIETLNQGGMAYVVQPDEVPGDAAWAALFRCERPARANV